MTAPVEVVEGREHPSPVLAPSRPTEEEKENLAEVLADSTVPWLTYAVHMRDEQMVYNILAGLDHQELLGLAVVLAARCPRPLMRPDDGDVDEVAVERACAGEPIPLTRLERVEAVRRLAGQGLGRREVSSRLRIQGTTATRLIRQVAAERERVSRVDDLEAERYAPVPAERGYWNRPTINEQDND